MNTNELNTLRKKLQSEVYPSTPMIMIGMGTCGIGNGADLVFNAIHNYLNNNKLKIELKQTGCFGFCAEEPLVMVYQPKKPVLVYCKVDEKDAVQIADSIGKQKIYQKKILCRIDGWDHITSHYSFGKGYNDIPHWDEIPFFKKSRMKAGVIVCV